MDDIKTFMVEDASLHWRNFQGREGPYNQAGTKTFCVDVDPDTATAMQADGWNVKFHKAELGEEGPHIVARHDGVLMDLTKPYIPVEARYDKGRKPRIVMITSTARTNLTEDNVEVLDWVDIETVDLICNGSFYEVNGKSGLKAYLKSMFITIREDALERKYQVNENAPTE